MSGCCKTPTFADQNSLKTMHLTVTETSSEALKMWISD